MAGLTLANAETALAAWIAADAAVANGQAYSIAGRSFTRTDARAITEKISFWEQQVQRLKRSGIKVIGATPV